MTIRRAAVLVRNLPVESATARAVHGTDVEWSTTDHLLALVADLLMAANWQRAGDKTKPKPKPIERPGERRRLTLSGREIQERLLDLQAKG